jgi:aryl-alcohol dehydrogenase-like predicted oxidoreductase
MTPLRKIGLGTVQWGMEYGIANRVGRPADAEVGRILVRAQAAGIGLLDTAAAYGEAEAVIGRLPQAQDFAIVTKTLPWRGDTGPVRLAEVAAGVHASLARLHRAKVQVLLVHHADELLSPHGEALWSLLEDAKAAGKAVRIGVSVYEPIQLAHLIERFAIEAVQLPFNLYDQRFLRGGMLAKLKGANIEVHARSSFLQGVLLMHPGNLPAHLAPLREHHARCTGRLESANATPLQAALAFCLHNDDVSRVIVGCETLAQLDGILEAGSAPSPAFDTAAFAVDDEALIDPRRWPTVH